MNSGNQGMNPVAITVINPWKEMSPVRDRNSHLMFSSPVPINYATQGWHQCMLLNSLPNKKILDWSKLKQIADDILKYI